MESEGFGAKLRELRQRARMIQKELADKVGIDFTYLSKIENGVMPPPSEKVILKLAEALNADQDELMLLAGKIPSDIAQVLKNGETLRRLRSDRAKQMARSSNKNRGDLAMLSKIFFNKSFSKVAIAFALALAVVGSLWFAAPIPARALTMTVPDKTGTIGGTATITGTVIVESGDILPIRSVDLEIYGGGNSETFTGLPLETISGVSYTGTNSSTASISAVAGAGWGYGYGNRTGYGWGYLIGWGTPGGYHDLGTNTFGYGYFPAITGVGTSIAYTAVWSVPSTWTAGSYTIRFRVHANSVDFVEDGTLTLSLPPAGGGGGAPAPTAPEGTTDVSDSVDPTGTFSADVTAQSTDGNVTLTVETGNQGLTAEGTPLTEITVQPVADPPAPPADSNAIGLTYDFGPDGATFSEPIEVAMSINLADLPAGVDPSNLYIARYNAATGLWERLPTRWDPVTGTLIAEVDHFTTFAVIAGTSPAAFSASSLTIVPAQADIGEQVTINATVTNTGDLTGNYVVTCKIDNVLLATKEVSLIGSDSASVSFTTTKNTAGTYTVTVDGLTGTFVVKAPPVPPLPPAPAAFEVSQLSILPAEVQVGEEVVVSATVANTGEVEGSYTVTLKINGATEATKKVTIAGGQTTKVTFSVVRDVAASYQVDIDGQAGSFTVTEAETPLAWWIWLIVGLAVVAVIVVVVVILRRRAY